MKGINEGIREIMDGRTPYQVFIEGIPLSEFQEGAYVVSPLKLDTLRA